MGNCTSPDCLVPLVLSALIPVKIPGTKRVDHKRAVKIYERAAGDKVLPSDLRPPEVLKVFDDFHRIVSATPTLTIENP